MKNFKTIAIALVVALTTLSATAQDKKINTATSKINWVGKKVTGEHSGNISFKDGVLKFKSGKLTGGAFTVDMNSIVVTDLTGDKKAGLEGHLKAEDFFGTAKNPTAKLAFKTVKATKTANVYAVTADLTIKNITKPVTFNLTVNKNSATTAFNVDRTKYDITYKSGSVFDGLGDAAISDEFELTVNLQF